MIDLKDVLRRAKLNETRGRVHILIREKDYDARKQVSMDTIEGVIAILQENNLAEDMEMGINSMRVNANLLNPIRLSLDGYCLHHEMLAEEGKFDYEKYASNWGRPYTVLQQLAEKYSVRVSIEGFKYCYEISEELEVVKGWIPQPPPGIG